MGTLFTSELKEGMITTLDTYSASGKLVLAKDTVITKSIINKLINNDVLFVEVSDEVALPPINDSEVSEVIQAKIEEEENKLISTPEYKKFKRRYDNHLEDFSKCMNDIIYKNSYVDIDSMLSGTNAILKASSSPLGIFTMMSTLKNYDDSTFNHSLNVGLICNILAKWLEFPDDQVQLITACGLFHDIGKLMIPDEIIKKPGKLTKEEFDIVKTHSKRGYDILAKKKVDIHIQYSALMHHEKCDGSGYPLKLKGSQIDYCSQIVTIADIYDAMTSKRVYRGPLSPFAVINHFEQDGLKKYNPKYLMTFFEHVVNSYLNCKVKLSNGEQGDIVYINKVNLSKPMIKTRDNFIDLSKNTNISIEEIL